MRCPACQADNAENSRFCGNCAAPLQPLEQKPPELTKTMPPLIDTMARGNIFASRYEIIEELGRGGMGRVYKVYDQKIKEVVALKLINPEYAAREKTIERFRDELRLARKIIHKNVCRMYDLSEEEGTSFITMEYVSGEDLRSMIRMMGALSPGQAVNIGKQICEGLGEAHRLGIIHRDLKPKNIIVDREGNARIMDFGIARSSDEKGLTGEKVGIGTPQYMSPEQVKGEKVDSRSDLYSLGIILYEMVTGRVPFDGETPLSIAVKHKTEPPPDPRRINAQISEALVRVIFRCLEKDRQKRYQSTEEVLAALKEIEKDITSTRQILIKEKPGATRTKEMTIRLPSRRIVIPALIVLAVVVAAIFIWLRISRREWLPVRLVPSTMPRLAVLYFKNNTGDESLDNWRSTLSDWFINELQGSSDRITVLSPDIIISILTRLNLYDAKNYSAEDLQKIAATGAASHILVGSYSKAGSLFRIICDLREASTGKMMSAREDGKNQEDFLAMVGTLSKKVMESLNLPAREAKAKVLTRFPLAQNYYDRGRHVERRYVVSGDEKDFEEGVEWFKKAIKEEPHFALPYWGLGDAYEHHYSYGDRKEDFDLMLKYYEEAYKLDPNLAGANAGLGWASFHKEEIDKAYSYFQRAYELDPYDYYINFNVGSFLRSIGLFEKAVKYYSRAISLGDYSARTHRLRAICYENLGKYEEAEADTREAVRIEPEDHRGQLYLARLLVLMKKTGEAEKEIDTAEKLSPGHEDIQYTRAWLCAAKGEKEEALSLIKGAESKAVFYSYVISRIYAVLGFKDRAIEMIQQGIKRGFEEVKEYLYTYLALANPKNYFYDGLRDDPRFKEILRNAEKTYYERLRKYNQL